MNKHLLRKIIILAISLLLLNCSLTRTPTTEDLQRAFVEMRFGAFIHFGIMTFTGGKWGEPNQDVTKFNFTTLDCNQWAEAFAAAKMQYTILTTKHHDGFCLWDSKYTANDVASSEWNGDITMKVVTFPLAKARYIRLEAIAAVDDFAAATEIAIGRGKNQIIIK